MDDLETRLKSLRVREPSQDLRRRIFFDSERDRKPVRHMGWAWQRIPLAWAATFSLLMGCVGFLLARQMQAPPQTGGSSTVEVRIVERPAGQDVFDFTPSPVGFPKEGYRVEVKTNQEV